VKMRIITYSREVPIKIKLGEENRKENCLA